MEEQKISRHRPPNIDNRLQLIKTVSEQLFTLKITREKLNKEIEINDTIENQKQLAKLILKTEETEALLRNQLKELYITVTKPF